ncbi:hypothetical protein N7510_000218 [Penicillium lagena]|uniref:uncharacterized protein n=1 Tax=Penicillium lagena TaxID=94218 RepID=UPI00254117CC|nr:uncharacterized protein N7510_000218 [Penicillium lagena]KAJ5623909.1 hypothetical protein N7510_000218 [Penicillium lagena]
MTENGSNPNAIEPHSIAVIHSWVFRTVGVEERHCTSGFISRPAGYLELPMPRITDFARPHEPSSAKPIPLIAAAAYCDVLGKGARSTRNTRPFRRPIILPPRLTYLFVPYCSTCTWSPQHLPCVAPPLILPSPQGRQLHNSVLEQGLGLFD